MSSCEKQHSEASAGLRVESRKLSSGNIFLEGYRWGGKTTAGKLLATRLGKTFVDLDDVAEERLGMSIDDFVVKCGNNWEPFRDIETQILEEYSLRTNTVFATGGGIAEKSRNVDVMKVNGIVVYYRAKAETLQQRALQEITEHRARRRKLPLLPGSQSSIDEIPSVLAVREPSYIAAADIVINTDTLTADSLVEESVENVTKLAA